MAVITLKFDAKDWKTARWVINCFQSCVHDSYIEGSIRRVQADKLTKKLHEQARRQVNKLTKRVRLEDHYDT